uniref:Uncharacterized protein n=1 Tax=Anguilla anguilla TaxID=7936 RepID=A0A0E9XC30_ANGAN
MVLPVVSSINTTETKFWLNVLYLSAAAKCFPPTHKKVIRYGGEYHQNHGQMCASAFVFSVCKKAGESYHLNMP